MMERTVAIIPLRKGSKSIKNKNKIKVLGRPLYSWVLNEAIHSKLTKIVIFTDDTEIIDVVNHEYKWSEKVEAILRDSENASDTASTESAMMELAKKIEFNFDNYMLLQATSPLITSNDINKSIEILKNYDSLLSVVKTHRFAWEDGESINYNYLSRPRRQDFKGLLIENGAIYVSKKSSYLKSQNRISGKIGMLEMHEDTLTEVDEEYDLKLIEVLLKNRLSNNKKAQKIKAIAFDVDGVFTNATVLYSKNGEFAKQFSFVDGMGFELLKQTDIIPIIITSENSPIVKKRIEKLNIKEYYPGIKDKFALLSKICKDQNINRSEIAYIGDDINDLANIVSVGWGICPANAVNEVKNNADLILKHNGGYKAIRETIEFIISNNKRYERS